MLTLLANLVTLESVVYCLMVKVQATIPQSAAELTQRGLLHTWILSSSQQESLLQSQMFTHLELY